MDMSTNSSKNLHILRMYFKNVIIAVPSVIINMICFRKAINDLIGLEQLIRQYTDAY